jgi:putative hemolysin
VGDLEVKLAEDIDELHAAQALRYRVFVEDMGATATEEMHEAKRDWDDFDLVCDHLLVLDRSREERGKSPVVGTYRLFLGSKAKKFGKFYSESEFDITGALNCEGEILELGRSCVHPEYRNRSSMQLLWKGIGAYVMHYNIKLLFGCASFPGTDVEEIKSQLSYLHHNHLVPEEYRIKALDELYVDMNLLPAEECSNTRIIAKLPPLIKGYLRLGGYVGEGAVLDHAYNTTDVSIMVFADNLTKSYSNKFTPPDTDRA